MKHFNFRLSLVMAFCAVNAITLSWSPSTHHRAMAQDAAAAAKEAAAAAAATEAAAAAEEAPSLAIGSVAPELNVEHWINDGNGFFKPVTAFEKDKVYVVEFWATWCGPCVQSMPHLVELQNRTRGQNVQIVSISDEPLETVTEFLKRETTNAEGDATTFAALTSAYCLTADPDRSNHEAYMEAAGQNGIPTAFIVGKDGKIEWIGHPMEMDEPLDLVVKGEWDREQYAKEFKSKKRLDEVMQQLGQLANRGRIPEAIQLLEKELENAPSAQVASQLGNIRLQLKMMGGMIDDDVVEFFSQRLKASEGSAINVARMSYSLLQAAQNPAAKASPGMKQLLQLAVDSLSKEVDGAAEEVKPLVLDTVAHLQEAAGDFDAAIATQEKAISIAPESNKERLSGYLEQLKEAKAEAAKPKTEGDAPKAE
jgi:thiol-disulfide isomerase/thioredoxin